MCTPTKGDVKKLRRLGRYLITTPRTVVRYNWQSEQESLYSFSDSDFAGCRRTAKSTSGGVVMLGTHYIKSWSSTRKTIALSSGEAELTAVVKCSCETIGVLEWSADWSMELEGEILVDSSEALGVVGRKGAGKLRHVRVGQLWVQEKAESGELRYRKVKGTENPADLMTKALTGPEIQKYMAKISLQGMRGRADMSLEAQYIKAMQRGEAAKKERGEATSEATRRRQEMRMHCPTREAASKVEEQQKKVEEQQRKLRSGQNKLYIKL